MAEKKKTFGNPIEGTKNLASAVSNEGIAVPFELLRMLLLGATSPELIAGAGGRNADFALPSSIANPQLPALDGSGGLQPLLTGRGGDKDVHALASFLAAQRLGGTGADVLGFAQEIPTALMNLLSGQPVFNEPLSGPGDVANAGFSERDILANLLGRNEGVMQTQLSSLPQPPSTPGPQMPQGLPPRGAPPLPFKIPEFGDSNALINAILQFANNQ